MAPKMITITKNGREAQIVESSLKVWKDKGWSIKGESKPKPKTESTETSKESATD